MFKYYNGQREHCVPGSEVIGDCKPFYGCWEPNPDPLKEHLVLLITELSLQPQEPGVFYCKSSDYTKRKF